MNFKTWWYDTKSTKWQIIIGTLLIGFVFIGTFAFLDTYQFEEWEYSGFAKSMMGILMGTVALGVITGVIIIFQSIISMDREKNQKIFDERLKLYKEFTNKTMGFISDDDLSEEEIKALKVIEKEVLMIASSSTYMKWLSLYQEILKKYDSETKDEDEITLSYSISDKFIEFVNSCRIDLEIGVIDKETIEHSKSESRAEIRKGSKTIYSGIDEKIKLLRNAKLNEKGINAWELILRRLEEVRKKEDKCIINFTKSACSFYNKDISSNWLLYIHNPGKETSGFNIEVRRDIYNDLIDKYNLQDSENIEANNSRNAIEIKAKLFNEVGETRFNEIAEYCLNCVLDQFNEK